MNKKTVTVISIAAIIVISVVFALITGSFSGKNAENTTSPDTTPPVTAEASETESAESENTEETAGKDTSPSAPQFTTAPEGYFTDVLFIGDSRTVGLYEYGKIEGATFFASTGLSVYKISSDKVEVPGVGTVTLAELLSQRQYKGIYLMTGVNELGYDQETTARKYGELLDTVKSLQPDAVIYASANLHVSKAKSDSDDIYNNKNIDAFNTAISEFADNETVFFIDVNELFDDGEGNLAAEYTYDDSHPLGKYYRDWAAWLAEKVIIK